MGQQQQQQVKVQQFVKYFFQIFAFLEYL